MLGSEEMREGPALHFQWCHLLPAPPSPSLGFPPGVTPCQSCHHPYGDQRCHGWDLWGDASTAPRRYCSALKFPDTRQVPPPLAPGPQGRRRRMQIALVRLVGFSFFFSLFPFFFCWLSHLPSLSIFDQLSQPWVWCSGNGKVIPLHQGGTAHTPPLCTAPQPTPAAPCHGQTHCDTFLPLGSWGLKG